MRVYRLFLLWWVCVAALSAGESSPLFSAPESGVSQRSACIVWSDGTRAEVPVIVRPDLKILMLPDGAGKRQHILWANVRSLAVTVIDEGEEEIWRWKSGGSDEKIRTGESYPWRRYGITVTTYDGHSFTGALSKGFAVQIIVGTEERQIVFNAKNKGNPGQRLTEWVYVKELNFSAAPTSDK